MWLSAFCLKQWIISKLDRKPKSEQKLQPRWNDLINTGCLHGLSTDDCENVIEGVFLHSSRGHFK